MLLTLPAPMGLVLLLPRAPWQVPLGCRSLSRRTCVITKGCWKPLLPGDPYIHFLSSCSYIHQTWIPQREVGEGGEKEAQAFGREPRTDLWPKCWRDARWTQVTTACRLQLMYRGKGTRVRRHSVGSPQCASQKNNRDSGDQPSATIGQEEAFSPELLRPVPEHTEEWLGNKEIPTTHTQMATE